GYQLGAVIAADQLADAPADRSRVEMHVRLVERIGRRLERAQAFRGLALLVSERALDLQRKAEPPIHVLGTQLAGVPARAPAPAYRSPRDCASAIHSCKHIPSSRQQPRNTSALPRKKRVEFNSQLTLRQRRTRICSARSSALQASSQRPIM